MYTRVHTCTHMHTHVHSCCTFTRSTRCACTRRQSKCRGRSSRQLWGQETACRNQHQSFGSVVLTVGERPRISDVARVNSLDNPFQASSRSSSRHPHAQTHQTTTPTCFKLEQDSRVSLQSLSAALLNGTGVPCPRAPPTASNARVTLRLQLVF